MSIYTKLENYYFNNYWKTNFALVSLFSSFVLSTALIIDYFLGFDPCILCVLARIPYVAFLIFALIGFAFEKSKKIIVNLLFFTALIATGIAIYHTGVERSWWNPAFNCSPSIRLGENTNLEDFLTQLDNAPLSDCSRPAFYIMGLSLAEVNIIINFILTAIFIKLTKDAQPNI